MKVRDRTEPRNSYKGQECFAVDAVCPCRMCYNCHDTDNKYYGGKIHHSYSCATNYNSGCPQPKPEPEHIVGRGGFCKRCGVKLS